MKVKFDTVITDLGGKAFKIKESPEDKTGEDMTLKDVVLNALCSPLEEDRNMTGKQSFERLELSRRINKGGDQDISAAESAMIQNRLPKLYGVMIAGMAYDLLNG